MDYFQLSTRKGGFITLPIRLRWTMEGEMMLFSIATKEREPLISGECKKLKKRQCCSSPTESEGKFVSLEMLAPLKQGDTALLGKKKNKHNKAEQQTST